MCFSAELLSLQCEQPNDQFLQEAGLGVLRIPDMKGFYMTIFTD